MYEHIIGVMFASPAACIQKKKKTWTYYIILTLNMQYFKAEQKSARSQVIHDQFKLKILIC